MSSSNDSFRNYSMTDEPEKELYSPFLDEALFADEEADKEWEMRLMELQTPFLEAFDEEYETQTEVKLEEDEEFLDEFDEEQKNETFNEFLEKFDEYEFEDYELDETFSEEEALTDLIAEEEEKLEAEGYEKFFGEIDEEELDENDITDFETEIDKELDSEGYEEFFDEMDEEELDENEDGDDFTKQLADESWKLEDQEFKEFSNQTDEEEFADFEAEIDEEPEAEGYEEFFDEMDKEKFDEEVFAKPDKVIVDWESFESERNLIIPTKVSEFATKLGKEWWSRRGGGSPSAQKIADWLLQDYQDTIIGARRRKRNHFNKGKWTVEKIGRAWMISREEQMRFKTASTNGIKHLKNFVPPSDPFMLVSSSLIEGSDKAPVAPIVVRFVQKLRQHYRGYFRVDTYKKHGGRGFYNRGYSIDLWLNNSVLDERGFYPKTDAIKFLRAVGKTASLVDAEWRIIYNDFSVANTINQETGKRHVIFVGRVRKDKGKAINLNWHGPSPLILHFHLDLVPRKSDQNRSSNIPTSGTLTPAEPISSASYIVKKLPITAPLFLFYIKKGNVSKALAVAAQSGITNENILTDLIFYARRNNQPFKKLKKGDPLVTQWLSIRTQEVRPWLRNTEITNTTVKVKVVSVEYTDKKGKTWRGVQVRKTVRFRLMGHPHDIILGATAASEGGYDTVNLYDRGILSWGIMQWTFHRGSLQNALAYIKQRLANMGQSSLWIQLFPSLDIRKKAGKNQLFYQGRPIIGENQLRLLLRGYTSPDKCNRERAERWATIFALAGRNPTIQKLQQEYARKRVEDVFDENLGKILGKWKQVDCRRKKLKGVWTWICPRLTRSPHFYRSNYTYIREYVKDSLKAKTLLFGMWTNNPVSSRFHLKMAVDRLAQRYGSLNIATWPSGWSNELTTEFERVLRASNFGNWGDTKDPRRKRKSRTRKILDAFKKLTTDR